MLLSQASTELIVGARASPLSYKQVEEVALALKEMHPHVRFSPVWLKTYGDLDRSTSLRDLGKTDFFTAEIDELLLKGGCRIAVHSAKDLPEPLPHGLICVALTKGVDPCDALVMPFEETLFSLPPYAKIATSSYRREECVRSLRSDLTFVDIRGTIEERLRQLQEEKVQGVVIAEAALIRLGLIHLNRLILPGQTAPLQGRLAVIARQDDLEMRALFTCLDAR